MNFGKIMSFMGNVISSNAAVNRGIVGRMDQVNGLIKGLEGGATLAGKDAKLASRLAGGGEDQLSKLKTYYSQLSSATGESGKYNPTGVHHMRNDATGKLDLGLSGNIIKEQFKLTATGDGIGTVAARAGLLYAGGDIAARATSGGSIGRNDDGHKDIVGIPFI